LLSLKSPKADIQSAKNLRRLVPLANNIRYFVDSVELKRNINHRTALNEETEFKKIHLDSLYILAALCTFFFEKFLASKVVFLAVKVISL
jgi:hypothetical protein